jgi:hypothetical protein
MVAPKPFSNAQQLLHDGALGLALAHGHEMGEPVRDDADGPAWSSPVAYECQRCGAWMLVFIMGDDSQDPVTGRAVRVDCRG